MRRRAAWVAMFLLVAPLAARLAATAGDAEAARCAIACARAGMGMEKGDACCPTGHGAAIPTLSSCAHGEGAALPGAVGPMLLVAALLLSLPSMSSRRRLVPPFALPFAPARVPDKVPILFG